MTLTRQELYDTLKPEFELCGKIDEILLNQFVDYQISYQMALDDIAKNGLTKESKANGMVANPAVAIKDKAATMIQRIAFLLKKSKAKVSNENEIKDFLFNNDKQ